MPDGFNTALNTLVDDRTRGAAQATARQSVLDAQREQNIAAEQRELTPLENQAQAAEGQLSAVQPPKPTELPKWEPKPIISSQDFQKFSWQLLGMALVGGVASRGNWMRVSSSLNGAMQGYIQGSKDRADRELKNYQTRFTEAVEHDKQAQKEFEDILTSRNLSINSMLAQVKIAAAKYGREDIRQAAEQKSIDAIWRQVEATDRSIAQLEEQHERTQVQLSLGNARIKATGGGTDHLDAYGNWFIQQTLLGSNTKFLQLVQSRAGGALAADAFNKLGAQLQAAGIDPRQMTEQQLNLAVQKTVQTQVSTRIAGVQRLTGSLKAIESEVSHLVQRVNASGMKTANATFNKIASEFGDDELSELKTLLAAMGRQYMEAVTAPGSNAQLHNGAQEWADQHFDPNMNIAMLQGTLKAMNLEIQATDKELQRQLENSRKQVVTQGPTLPVPGAATPPAGPTPSVGGTSSAPQPSSPAEAAPSSKVVDFKDLM